MPLNDEPLNDEEFDQLDEFLLSDRCPEDAMTMDSLHGFLTALLIGPESVSMSEWLPHVWGAEAGGTPSFKSAKEQEQIAELILRFMNEITLTFSVAPKDYEPLFCEHEWNGKALIDGEGWAMGFWEGVKLRPAAWEPIWSSEAAPLMHAIYLLGSEDIEDNEEALVDDPVKRHKLSIEVEANILAIRRFWLDESQAASQVDPQAATKPVKRSAAKVSGNGPCACGSGKKFKQCCGAEPVLH